jgi:hypothetical protein
MAFIFDRNRLVKLEGVIKEYYQPAMNLSNWQIFVCLDRPKCQDAQLETEVVPCRYVANICVGHMFENLSIQEKHNAVIHELLHLPQDRLGVQINSLMINAHVDLKTAIYEIFRNEIEYNTDWLAGILEKYIPIPYSLYEWSGQENQKPED